MFTANLLARQAENVKDSGRGLLKCVSFSAQGILAHPGNAVEKRFVVARHSCK